MGCDLTPYHNEIAASLLATGSLPEDFGDLFEVRLVPAADGNPDGTPRYVLTAR